MAWELTGNSGTNPSTNFLGTIDNQPLSIKSNGKEALHINTNGNVGIGTASPDYTLDVKSTRGIKLGLEGNGGGQLILGNNPNDNMIYLEAFSADGQGSADELLITGRFVQPLPRISLRAINTSISGNLSVEGNVGIGTTTPGQKLSVVGVVESTSGGFRFPDGSLQITATLRGAQGPVGPQGPAGPAVRTVAICVFSGNCNCIGGKFISLVSGPCQVTADTGSCSQNGVGGSCCVCKPL
jgi:hypothetical protein